MPFCVALFTYMKLFSEDVCITFCDIFQVILQLMVSLSVLLSWHWASCGTHDHTVICSQSIIALLVVMHPFWQKAGFLSLSTWCGAVICYCLENFVYNVCNLSDMNLHYIQGLLLVHTLWSRLCLIFLTYVTQQVNHLNDYKSDCCQV